MQTKLRCKIIYRPNLQRIDKFAFLKRSLVGFCSENVNAMQKMKAISSYMPIFFFITLSHHHEFLRASAECSARFSCRFGVRVFVCLSVTLCDCIKTVYM